MSIEVFALELGIDAAYLSRIERGQKNISLTIAAKLADALNFELFLGGRKFTK